MCLFQELVLLEDGNSSSSSSSSISSSSSLLSSVVARNWHSKFVSASASTPRKTFPGILPDMQSDIVYHFLEFLTPHQIHTIFVHINRSHRLFVCSLPLVRLMQTFSSTFAPLKDIVHEQVCWYFTPSLLIIYMLCVVCFIFCSSLTASIISIPSGFQPSTMRLLLPGLMQIQITPVLIHWWRIQTAKTCFSRNRCWWVFKRYFFVVCGFALCYRPALVFHLVFHFNRTRNKSYRRRSNANSISRRSCSLMPRKRRKHWPQQFVLPWWTGTVFVFEMSLFVFFVHSLFSFTEMISRMKPLPKLVTWTSLILWVCVIPSFELFLTRMQNNHISSLSVCVALEDFTLELKKVCPCSTDWSVVVEKKWHLVVHNFIGDSYLFVCIKTGDWPKFFLWRQCIVVVSGVVCSSTTTHQPCSPKCIRSD